MNPQERIKLDAAAKAARYAYRRELPKAIRKASKATGWRSVQGCLYREINGWFVDASPSVNLLRKETRLLMCAKPMEIDPVFWKIVGLRENLSQPLSFRLIGRWTCRPPYFRKADVAESDDLDNVAASFVSLADELLPAVDDFTIEDFLQLCHAGVSRPENFLACTVTALIIMGNKENARELCKQAKEGRAVGGFMSGRKSFPQMAIEWLDSDTMELGD